YPCRLSAGQGHAPWPLGLRHARGRLVYRRRTTMGTARRKARDGEQGENAMLAAARDYTRRGWRVVPVRPGGKGVTLSGWQHLRLAEKDLPRWFRGTTPHNIGILTGAPSGGLVDVDCDAPEAREAAAELLPPTGLISGRASSPASHYWYQIGAAVLVRMSDMSRTVTGDGGALPA